MINWNKISHASLVFDVIKGFLISTRLDITTNINMQYYTTGQWKENCMMKTEDKLEPSDKCWVAD